MRPNPTLGRKRTPEERKAISEGMKRAYRLRPEMRSRVRNAAQSQRREPRWILVQAFAKSHKGATH